MAKNFYAVKRGFDKKQNKEITDIITDDWYEVAPLVKGYNNARYKGFDTKEEAETWLSVVDRTDAERRAKETIDKAKEEIGISDTDTHTLADEYAEALDKLIKEYKKLGWDKLATIGNLTSVIVNEVEKIYK
jgi:viroplasmin and RNaseH domain-containing protein